MRSNRREPHCRSIKKGGPEMGRPFSMDSQLAFFRFKCASQTERRLCASLNDQERLTLSWDLIVFAADTPLMSDADGAVAFPEGWEPSNLGALSEIQDGISQSFLYVDWMEPTWGLVKAVSFSIEFSLGKDDQRQTFGLHARGQATAAVLHLIDTTGWRILDVQTGKWLNGSPNPDEGREQFQSYLDIVLKARADLPRRSGDRSTAPFGGAALDGERNVTKQEAADLTKQGTQLGRTVADVTRKTTVWYFVLAPLTLLYLAVVFKIATSMRPISGLLGLPANHLYAIGANIGVLTAPLIAAIFVYVSSLTRRQRHAREAFDRAFEARDLVASKFNPNLI